MTLNDLKQGALGEVLYVHGTSALRRRIMDMGVTRGCTVRVSNVAPLGDPIEIEVRGYRLCLRREDADTIEVRYID